MRITLASGSSSLTIGKQIPAWLALLVLCAGPGLAAAAPVYNAGPLNFSTANQSMWGSGGATVFQDSVFLGPQWTNRTVGVGGIIGSASTVSVNTNPLWWAWKACVETVNVFCGGQPDPGTVSEVVDTRTGARVDLTTSGKFGLEFGYTVNSGSVDATADYSATAVLPDAAPKAGEVFNLNPASNLAGGSISSQSPKLEAHINAVAQLSGSVTARACLILAGCTPTGTAALPGLNLDAPVVSIDPNSLKILGELLPPDNPGEPRKPLAEVKLANQTLTLQAAVDATGTPGFKLTTTQFTIVDTTPPTPDVTIDLASIEFKLPNIATNSGPGANPIASSGRDDVIKMRLDVDGLAFALGSGTIPPLGLGLTLIDSGGFKIGMQFDGLDIDIGPDIGITQDFELTPTLMVRLDFSAPVQVDGFLDLQTSWEGAWGDLPDLALLETTTFTPTFWLDAALTNTIGIDLGLTGNWDIYKFAFSAEAGPVNILQVGPLSLNQLLGLGNTMFSTPKLEFPIWDTPFQLQGFSEIQAAPFTIALAVPAPGPLALLLAALGAAAFTRRRAAARSATSASTHR
jgi:hypothetical protein